MYVILFFLSFYSFILEQVHPDNEKVKLGLNTADAREEHLDDFDADWSSEEGSKCRTN